MARDEPQGRWTWTTFGVWVKLRVLRVRENEDVTDASLRPPTAPRRLREQSRRNAARAGLCTTVATTAARASAQIRVPASESSESRSKRAAARSSVSEGDALSSAAEVDDNGQPSRPMLSRGGKVWWRVTRTAATPTELPLPDALGLVTRSERISRMWRRPRARRKSAVSTALVCGSSTVSELRVRLRSASTPRRR